MNKIFILVFLFSILTIGLVIIYKTKAQPTPPAPASQVPASQVPAPPGPTPPGPTPPSSVSGPSEDERKEIVADAIAAGGRTQ